MSAGLLASAPGVRPLPVYDPAGLQKIKDSQTSHVEIIPHAEATPPLGSLPALISLPSCKRFSLHSQTPS